MESFRFTTQSITLPLGLAYIAGALEQTGHRVKVIDAVGEAPKKHTRYFKGYLVGLSDEEVIRRIPDDAFLIGISVIFTHEWPAVVKLVERIKHARPNVTVALGGEHITSLPEFCLLTSQADVAVLGEGEETAVELVAAVRDGLSLEGMDGLAFRSASAVVVNKRRPRTVELGKIARPAWHHFGINTYHENRFVGGMYSPRLTMPILATRGCPYQCTYCSNANMWTPRWVPRDPVDVADEIEDYVREFGAGNFPFQDLTAIVKKDWMVSFCNEIIARGLDISWQLPTGTRSEAIDLEVAKLLKRSGLTGMAYAPESGSDLTRKLIKKKMTAEKLFRSIEAAVAADLNVSIFMVIGFPHDRVEHLAENLPFIERLIDSGARDVAIGYFMALPGTELFHSLYDSGKVRIDRAYFTHILNASSLFPSQNYCEHMGTPQLIWWRFKLLFHAYAMAGKKVSHSGRLLETLSRALSGLFKGEDGTKLPTAIRHGARGFWRTTKTKFTQRWLPRREEIAMLEGWDRIYKGVRRRHIETGVAASSPPDTSRLHTTNVVVALRRNHQTPRTLQVLPP